MPSLLSAFLILGVTTLSFYILHTGRDLILPFILAVLIWFLVNVLATAITRLGVRGRTLPASLRYIAAGAVIALGLGLVFNFITSNVSEVIRIAPLYQVKLLPLLEKAAAALPFKQVHNLEEFAAQFDFSQVLTAAASTLASLAGKAGLITIYVLFLFLEQRSFGPKIHGISAEYLPSADVTRILSRIDRDIRTYVGIKTLTSALTGLLGYAIMAAFGLDFAGFWGVLLFLFNFIPTFGSIVATILPSLLALLAFDSPVQIIVLISSLTALQIFIGLLEPRMMGRSLNLSPLVILLSLALWGSVLGIMGMFLCVPLTVVAMIIFSHFPRTRPVAILLSSNGRLEDHEAEGTEGGGLETPAAGADASGGGQQTARRP